MDPPRAPPPCYCGLPPLCVAFHSQPVVALHAQRRYACGRSKPRSGTPVDAVRSPRRMANRVAHQTRRPLAAHTAALIARATSAVNRQRTHTLATCLVFPTANRGGTRLHERAAGASLGTPMGSASSGHLRQQSLRVGGANDTPARMAHLSLLLKGARRWGMSHCDKLPFAVFLVLDNAPYHRPFRVPLSEPLTHIRPQ